MGRCHLDALAWGIRHQDALTRVAAVIRLVASRNQHDYPGKHRYGHDHTKNVFQKPGSFPYLFMPSTLYLSWFCWGAYSAAGQDMEPFGRHQPLPVHFLAFLGPLGGPQLQDLLRSGFRRTFDKVHRPSRRRDECLACGQGRDDRGAARGGRGVAGGAFLVGYRSGGCGAVPAPGDARREGVSTTSEFSSLKDWR